jgi:CheY-like chemotaxis protein
MINFLIVEDNLNKFTKISTLINSKIGNVVIKRVESVDRAIEQLKSVQFSFVIIDLNLPLMELKQPKIDGGITLLKWIKKNQQTGKCRVPSNIIGLTEYPDLIKKFSSELDLCRVFAYEYHENDESWKKRLLECVEEHALKLDQELIKVPSKRIVYSVHGIETNGDWQNELAQNLNLDNKEFIHFPYEYNFFPSFSFLIPPLRWVEVNRFKKELEYMARKHPDCTITLIGHSFGTYLIANALENISQNTTPSFDRIILCGSVLKSSFNWDNIICRHKIKNILNDCSLNDKPLILSQAIAIGLGMAGRVGFKRKYGHVIINRYFKGGHSDFFNSEIFGHWENFIKNGAVTSVNKREHITIMDRIAQYFLLCCPWLVLLTIAMSIVYLI